MYSKISALSVFVFFERIGTSDERPTEHCRSGRSVEVRCGKFAARITHRRSGFQCFIHEHRL